MHIRAGVVLCVALSLFTAAALADTFYKYRDLGTGRDVFVNRLDQVPRKYRSQAKVVLEVEKVAEAAEQPPQEVIEVPAKPAPEPTRIPAPASDTGAALRKAMSGKNLWKDGPALACAVIDAKLVAAGSRPLSGAERADFGDLLWAIVIASIVAGLFALVVWIVIVVTAVRDGHPWWGLFIFLFSPLAYVYLFLYAGKGRALFKTLCSVGMLSPALVGLVGTWRFYAWFNAIVQARGGHL